MTHEPRIHNDSKPCREEHDPAGKKSLAYPLHVSRKMETWLPSGTMRKSRIRSVAKAELQFLKESGKREAKETSSSLLDSP